jgi:hypothetical protein
MRWFQATRSASFRASVARSAECLIELPCSREISCPSPDNAPASLRSASRYGLVSGEIEPLPIVDVDKSFLQTRLLLGASNVAALEGCGSSEIGKQIDLSYLLPAL